MKASKIASAAALALILGAGAAPAFAGDLPATPQMTIHADVVPTLNETRIQLAQTRHQLRQFELASFYSPTAEADYRAAQIALANGRYDEAAANLKQVRAALTGIPNWKSSPLDAR
ncbi:MAG TPA: hypothetical protein VFB33_09160 [Candidatus Binataceae bacterium]|jgi:hypothetical protein|nr:hypothetical protein [Candidatus Binataceae bacterium]